MSDKPTKPQVKWLEKAANDPRGVVQLGWRGGFEWVSWKRMMERMCAKGWFTEYRHGGYEITEAGRAALRGAP